MAPTIDYYFTLISPFSYMGHAPFLQVAARHGAMIAYKPINLAGVFKESGAVPVPDRPIARQKYRLIELQRIAHFRNVPLTLRPAHFPTNPALANGAAAAILAAGGDPASFMLAAFQACWVHDQDIAQVETVRALLEASGQDASTVLAAATSSGVLAQMASNTEQAVAAGVVGAPGYVLAGEPFWGQDRVEYLDHALATGRGPFTLD